MGYRNAPPMDRTRIPSFRPTLGATIPDDHPVRVPEEILSAMDRREREARYHGEIGRPPIRAKVLASVVFYGLLMGLLLPLGFFFAWPARPDRLRWRSMTSCGFTHE